jgi:hypothetical protein
MPFYYLILCFTLVGCLNCNQESEKFDKVSWNEISDPTFPPSQRKEMVNDVINNRVYPGMNKKEVVNVLGEPNYNSGSGIIYRIIVEYGTDIDPVFTMDLEIQFSKDSLVSSVRIKEWRK